MAEWFAEGLLRRLLDRHDPISRRLLRDTVFWVVPNICPDGTWRGHLRTNAAGANLNREWAEPSPDVSPEASASGAAATAGWLAGWIARTPWLRCRPGAFCVHTHLGAMQPRWLSWTGPRPPPLRCRCFLCAGRWRRWASTFSST